MTTTVATEVRALANRFMAARSDEMVTYQQLSESIGRNVRQMNVRYLIYAALKQARKDNGAVFATVRGQGYRRMRTEEIPAIGKSARRKTRRSARAAISTISDGLRGANDLSRETRIEALREQSTLGLIAHIAQDRHLPQVEENATEPLPYAQVARQFLDRINGIKTGS